ncbi:hypothetical protein MTO96_051212 [Rhipicephalus appendiculatus]
MQAMQVKGLETDYPSNYGINLKHQNLDIPGLIKQVFGVDLAGKTFTRYPSGPAVLSVYDQGGWRSMNLAMFKFILKLAIFADEEDSDLNPFLTFAAKYEFGAKVLPVRVYRCGTFIENYLRPAMMQFVRHYDSDRLNAISSKARTCYFAKIRVHACRLHLLREM